MPWPASRPPAPADPLDRLQQLAVLRDGGALTPAEFEAQKALVLARAPWPHPGPDAGRDRAET